MCQPSRFMPKYVPRRPGPWAWPVLGVMGAGLGYGFWHHPWLLGVIFVIGIPVALLLDRHHGARLGALAAARPAESICRFARSFDVRALDPWVLRAVYEQLQDHLAPAWPRFPLRADDRLLDLLSDPDDLDLDLAPQIAARTGRGLEHTDRNPLYGRVETVRDLVLFFDAQPRCQRP